MSMTLTAAARFSKHTGRRSTSSSSSSRTPWWWLLLLLGSSVVVVTITTLWSVWYYDTATTALYEDNAQQASWVVVDVEPERLPDASATKTTTISLPRTQPVATTTTTTTNMTVLERARRCGRVDDHPTTTTSNNLTTAVCFKTLFGSIDLGLVLQWVGTFGVLGCCCWT
jgi:hypothetical protein